MRETEGRKESPTMRHRCQSQASPMRPWLCGRRRRGRRASRLNGVTRVMLASDIACCVKGHLPVSRATARHDAMPITWPPGPIPGSSHSCVTDAGSHRPLPTVPLAPLAEWQWRENHPERDGVNDSRQQGTFSVLRQCCLPPRLRPSPVSLGSLHGGPLRQRKRNRRLHRRREMADCVSARRD